MFLRNILAAAEISAIYVRMKRRMETGWGDFHLFLSIFLTLPLQTWKREKLEKEIRDTKGRGRGRKAQKRKKKSKKKRKRKKRVEGEKGEEEEKEEEEEE